VLHRQRIKRKLPRAQCLKPQIVPLRGGLALQRAGHFFG
jgi:hypothetical protein